MKNQEVSKQGEGNDPKSDREYLDKRAEAFGYIDKTENSLYELRIDENEASQISKRNELQKKIKKINTDYLGTRRNPAKLSEVLESARKLDAEMADFCKYVSAWENLTEEERLNAKKAKNSNDKRISRNSGNSREDSSVKKDEIIDQKSGGLNVTDIDNNQQNGVKDNRGEDIIDLTPEVVVPSKLQEDEIIKPIINNTNKMKLENPGVKVDAKIPKKPTEFASMKKKIEAANPEIVSGEANIAGEVYDMSEQEDIAEAEDQAKQAVSKKSLEKKGASGDEKLSAEDLDLIKKEIYQEGDAYVEDHVGEGQFEYRITPEKNRSKQGETEKEDDEPVEELEVLRKREAGKKTNQEAQGAEKKLKVEDIASEQKEIETWETLKRKRYSDASGKVVREREKKTRGRVFGEKKAPEVVGTSEKHKDRAAAGGRVFGENKDAFVLGHAEEAKKTEAMTEQEKQLEMLQSLVAEKRKAYATADYRSETLFSKIRGVLGLKNENMPANAKDSLAYQQYQGALNELRNLQIQMMRDKYTNIDALPPEEKAARMTEMRKEMGQMATYFGVCEKLDLAGARTDARTEAWSETKMGRLGKGALDWSAKRINNYRTMDRKKKIAISIVLLSLGGVGAISGSVGVVSAVAVSKGIQRWLGGAALGAGIATSLESRSRTKAKQKAEKDRGAIFENSEASWQEQLQALNEYCGNEMKTFHDSLQDEKYGASRRKLLGAGVGVFVGAGWAADCLKYGFSWVGQTETFGKVKDVASEYWKSSGASGIVGAGIESIKAHNPFSTSGGGAVEHGLRDTPASKLSPSANGMEEKFGMDEKFGPKGTPGSSVENGTRDNSSSKLASKVGGMYNELSDKVKGATIKFEKDYLQGTSTPDKVPLHPTEAQAHAGASDGDRFHPTEMRAGSSVHEFSDSGIGNRGIEGEFINKMRELGVSEEKVGKYAHRMTDRFIKVLEKEPDFKGLSRADILKKLSEVSLGEKISFNIDPNNLDNSNITNFRGFSGPHTDISPSGGSPIDSRISPEMEAQMENEARERGFNDKITGSSGRSAEVDAKISAEMNQEEISRGYNNEIMGEHTMNRPAGNVSPGNLESIESDLRDGARGSDNGVAEFSEQDSRPDMQNVSPGNLESIESDLRDGARGADNDVSKFSEMESNPGNPADIRGVELSLLEKANTEKIADIFDSGLIGGNNLADQIAEARNLKGADFYEAYGEIYKKIIGNTFSENGIGNLNARDYLEGNNSKVEALIQYNSDHFKDYSIEPTSSETMGAWMTRNINKALESCGIGLNDARFKT